MNIAWIPLHSFLYQALWTTCFISFLVKTFVKAAIFTLIKKAAQIKNDHMQQAVIILSCNKID